MIIGICFLLGALVLISLFIIMYLYGELYFHANIKISFQSFLSLYLMAPNHWHLNISTCYYSKYLMSNYYVYFSFCDYLRYLNFFYHHSKRQAQIINTEEEQEFLKMLQEDIEQYRCAAIEDQIKMYADIKRDQYRHETFLNIKHL